MSEFDSQYQNLLKEIMEKGYEETNKRTGHIVKALPGKTIEVEPEDGFPLLALRRTPFKGIIAEQIWFLTGSRRPADFLDHYTTKIWGDFTGLDGTVSTAYGWRWRHHFGRDQIGLLLKLLGDVDPSSRHAVVVTWDPATDGLTDSAKKANVPCPYTFTANIMGNKLNLHNIVRSNDMILGFPSDVAGFALLQLILAARLGVGVGKYTHSISHAHIYDNQFEVARDLIGRTCDHPPIQFVAERNYFERAERGDHSLVDEIYAKISNQYHPLGPIKRPDIVK